MMIDPEIKERILALLKECPYGLDRKTVTHAYNKKYGTNHSSDFIGGQLSHMKKYDKYKLVVKRNGLEMRWLVKE